MKPLRYISLMLIFIFFVAGVSNAENRAAVIKKKSGDSTPGSTAEDGTGSMVFTRQNWLRT
ncbi:MAG: hypothetical protein HQK88_15355 [Nitrospirae bacterium]|nr:hypothetical protein [Nitrospirota bacterium]MBF0536390.1 hypothetical protein [Nitrospirota bacterium]MBF0618178.1 hypothetical protein [Nitrospirota bacterium]